MDKYNEILEKVGKQQSAAEENYKMYRYTGLIHAIEFFSQRFSLDEIITHVYDFTNEMVVADRMVVFTINEEDKLVMQKGKGFDRYRNIQGHDLDQIVYYHAGILTQSILKEYMDPEGLAFYNPDIVIQLVMDKKLFGLIFLCRDTEPFNIDDKNIANALMNLYYTSLTNYESFNRLEELTKELDEKIYNLFAMNYSSKALLSELDEDSLNQLSISIFSEMTQSRVTAVFVYDAVREAYPLIQLQDVFEPDRTSRCILYPKDKQRYVSGEELIDCSDKAALYTFMNNFNNASEELLSLEPRYILPVCDQQQLVALITISEKVTGEPYKKSEFELLESLLSSTYIAMRNAEHMRQVRETQDMMRKQLDDLSQLNVLMKNLNTATSESALLQLMVTTLELSFGFTSMFFCKMDNGNNGDTYRFYTQKAIMEEEEGKMLPMSSIPEPLIRQEVMYVYDVESYEDFVERMNLSQELEENDFTGMVCIPISVDTDEKRLLGILGVGEVRTGHLFDKNRILILESIASHLAPVLYQIYERERIQLTYNPNYNREFLQRFHEERKDAEAFAVDFYVLSMSRHVSIHFDSLWEKIQNIEEVKALGYAYPVEGNHILWISEDKELFKEFLESPSIKDILEKEGAKLGFYSYGEDFVDLITLQDTLNAS